MEVGLADDLYDHKAMEDIYPEFSNMSSSNEAVLKSSLFFHR